MADSIRGVVFQVQRFCIHDGPGIRTVVFLKGCPLHCPWCHNPESKHRVPQMMCWFAKCTNCGSCVDVCPMLCHCIEEGKHVVDFTDCVHCGKCAAACRNEALEIIGEECSVEEVLCKVEKDSIFYASSGGGLTVSGGEPFLQHEFLLELLRKAKERQIHTAVETCGFVRKEILERVAPFVDLFLYDIKETDHSQHLQLTGGDLTCVLENLDMLAEMKKNVYLRCPIIPNINDRAAHFAAIAKLANRYDNILKVELEPYHNLGEEKPIGLGWDRHDRYRVPDRDEIQIWKESIQASCQKNVSVPAFD